MAKQPKPVFFKKERRLISCLSNDVNINMATISENNLLRSADLSLAGPVLLGLGDPQS